MVQDKSKKRTAPTDNVAVVSKKTRYDSRPPILPLFTGMLFWQTAIQRSRSCHSWKVIIVKLLYLDDTDRVPFSDQTTPWTERFTRKIWKKKLLLPLLWSRKRYVLHSFYSSRLISTQVLKVTESPNANDDNDALVDFDSTTIKYVLNQTVCIPKACWMAACRRIMAFQNYADPSTNTFAVDKLPKEREWGTKGPFEDKSTILCKPGTNEPYIVWIVGRVSRTWFFDRESNPAMQVAINVVPINDPTGTNTRQTICVLSKPPICEWLRLTWCNLHDSQPSSASTVDGWGDLRATKWQNSRSVGGSDGAVSRLYIFVFIHY
jgi:hypothetical protein